jgi:hypothetical protein
MNSRQIGLVLLAVAAVVAASLSVSDQGAATLPPYRACPGPNRAGIEQLRWLRKTGELRADLWGQICGPHHVVPGTNYSYAVFVTNMGTKRSGA